MPEVLRALEGVFDFANTKGLVINFQECLKSGGQNMDRFSLEGFLSDIPRAGGPGVVYGAQMPHSPLSITPGVSG